MGVVARVAFENPNSSGISEAAHNRSVALASVIEELPSLLAQAKEFNEALGLTGLVLTKLDGTAKGGVVIGICDTLNVPLRYIGVGEQIDDLQQFESHQFVQALFS